MGLEILKVPTRLHDPKVIVFSPLYPRCSSAYNHPVSPYCLQDKDQAPGMMFYALPT